MNKGILVGVVILVIIALGAVGFFVTRGSNDRGLGSSQPTTNKMTDSSTSESSTSQSLRGLMMMQEAQHCTYSDNDTTNTGEVFVSNGKVRGDFTSRVGDNTISAHTISDGTNVYVWTDDSITGFKSDLSSMNDIPESEQRAENNQTVDVNKIMNLKCEPWVVENTKFDLPSDIEFNNYDAIMKSVFEGADPDSKAVQCETCDSLPDDAQSQCRELLGC